jgi:sugar/nucleoside kinase (ribokinase family)
MTSHPTPDPPSNGSHGIRPRLLAVGDNVVDVYPQQGVMYPGGNAVNVAVHAKRQGAQAAYLGAVGTDLAGEVVLGSLRAEGVDTSLTRIVDGPNAAALVHVVDGNRVFAGGDVGVSVFELSSHDLAVAAGFDIVHTGECSHIEDQLGELARCSSRLSFDFSERPWDYVQQYAALASIAISSAPDGDLSQATRQVERLRALGPVTAVVTLGAAGAVVLEETLTYRPAPPGRIVDTLGAGDAFIARLLVGLARSEPIGTLLSAATTYATGTCASFGAFGYPSAISPVHNPVLTQPADRIPNEAQNS